MLKKQDHACSKCGLNFWEDEKVHLHHVDGNHENWENKNLVAVHQSCHQGRIMQHRQGDGRDWKFERNLSQKPILPGAVCGESRTYGSN
ncbi:hypothetical protein CCP3SC1AL1_2320004 [Gammaproteobacteria bacterium]